MQGLLVWGHDPMLSQYITPDEKKYLLEKCFSKLGKAIISTIFTGCWFPYNFLDLVQGCLRRLPINNSLQSRSAQDYKKTTDRFLVNTHDLLALIGKHQIRFCYKQIWGVSLWINTILRNLINQGHRSYQSPILHA